MGSYDVKRLDVAIQYINRMTSGRNPVTNRPAPDNEVLTNPNVHRCLQFISEVLQDVRSQGGIVGKPPGRSTEAKMSMAQTFPYEALKEYRYIQDQQISYFLKQISELSAEEREVPAVPAVHINNWLREKGYLEKRMMPEFGKEISVPTEKGTRIGIYSERAGMGSNQYYRIWFNEQAQRFLIDHFREILTETEEIRARKKQERKANQGEKKKRQSGHMISRRDNYRIRHKDSPGIRHKDRHRDSRRDRLREWHRSGLRNGHSRRPTGSPPHRGISSMTLPFPRFWPICRTWILTTRPWVRTTVSSGKAGKLWAEIRPSSKYS